MKETLVTTPLAHEVKENVLGYLSTTYNIKNESFRKSLQSFLESEKGIFKGPYIDMKLPFKMSPSGRQDMGLDLKLGFEPYEHQVTAFKRLNSKGKKPENTLIVTGTGSGKSECFFIPIVDHCLREKKKGLHGIKAMIIYPMNALATDQASRITEFLFEQDQVTPHKNNLPLVSVGLFIGEDIHLSQKRSSYNLLAKQHIKGDEYTYHAIDDRSAMIKNPPDILLTNYKMLDNLLMKPEFDPLWKTNGGESLLKYLVLDEMHAFDGAQGSDVALLIRRLKAKLGLTYLNCVGTSATLLSDIKGEEVLIKFANRLFGESFTRESIIPESRQSIEEVFATQSLENTFIPPNDSKLNYHDYTSLRDYMKAQIKAWFHKDVPDEIHLGQELQKHVLTKALLQVLDNRPLSEKKLLEKLKERNIAISSKQLGSFLSLLSHAKKEILLEGKPIHTPLYFIRVQLWVKELSRIISTLDMNKPQFLWFDDKVKMGKAICLPPVFCEECGEQGFLTQRKGDDEGDGKDFERDIHTIYQSFAKGEGKNEYLFPWKETDKDTDSSLTERNKIKICPTCGNFEYEDSTKKQQALCPIDKTAWQYFTFHQSTAKESKRDKRECPSCETRNSLRLVGSRITTLTSVINSQLFLSTLNPQESKKLLVFADSVQDASHRAGYYNARTYRFNFRTAIQSFLKQHEGSFKLCQLTKPFLDYWTAKMGEEKVLATFVPSDLQKSLDYKNSFEGKGNHLRSYLEKRVEWEFFLEYSLRSQVGRTLEKTLCSAIYIDDEDLQNKLADSFENIANEYEVIRQAGADKYRGFVLGIIKRLLHKGGISLEVFKKYREEENAWYLGKNNEDQKWISNLPRGRLKKGSDLGALPKFLSDNSKKVFEYFGESKWENWYSKWVKKNLPCEKSFFTQPEFYRLYKSLFEQLVEKGIFHEIENPSEKWTNYGLRYENISVTLEVKRLQCNRCTHKIVIPTHHSELWIDTPCITMRCHGKYGTTIASTKEQDYYRRIYEAGEVERIFAHEHTGLLSRKIREEVETDFKKGKGKGRKANSINLLSCTPTLEMGIDVGDLSAIVIGSLPRTASNYQQQVGRAGRKSGSAFIVSVAETRPRDLLYFQSPEELIAGNVQPPGCFLDAGDLIKRQVFAFLFDNYLNEIKGENELKLHSLSEEIRGVLKGPGVISHLEKLLREKGTEVLARYKKYLHSNDVHSDTWKEVDSFFSPIDEKVSIVESIKAAVLNYEREMNEIRPALVEVNKKIKELKQKEEKTHLSSNEETELKEMRRDHASLSAQKELIGGKDGFFEFLTRHGLLPNYAFQEDVIELTGIILSDEKYKVDKKTFIKQKEQFLRPAKMALREFAPGNTFYAGGYKLEIEQLDVGGARKTLIQKWRICRACGHLQRQVDSKNNETLSCPKCADTLWGDRGSELKMLKMSKVVAVQDAISAHVGDESDSRDKKFFKIRPYFELEDKSIQKAWKYSANDFVFGMEFLSRMTLREVNFGENGATNQTISIAGEALPTGFLVCPKCGRVGINKKGQFKIHHTSTCPDRKYSTNDSRTDEDKGEKLLLFRELQSEAIRLLLPASDYEAEIRVCSIKAAIMLGFREKFGGQPLHLEISEQRVLEPSGNKLFKRYLVIFDSVPGGTGFLRELWDKDSFYDLIEKAYKKLKSCSCNENKDLNGCPKCILSGIGQFEIPHVERDEAIKYLEKILANKDQMEEFSGSLDSVSINRFLDSDLESRFVNVLESCAKGEYKKKLLSEFGLEIKDFKFTDKAQYKATFKVKRKGEEYEYEMIAHHNLGDGANLTEADFVFKPIGSQEKGNNSSSQRPIALYLDGFEYHASKSSGSRFSSDFKKRQALFNGDEVKPHFVWNLTWNDLKQFETPARDNKIQYIGKGFSKSNNFLGENHLVLLFRHLSGEKFNQEEFKKLLLTNSESKRKLNEAFLHKIKDIDLQKNIISRLKSQFESESNKGEDIGAFFVQSAQGVFFYFCNLKNKEEKAFLLAMCSPIQGREGDIFLQEWEGFLHTWNVIQLFSSEAICKVWAEAKKI